MLATVFVLSLVLVAFWRSLFKMLAAALLVLVVVGGIEAVKAIGAIVPVAPEQSNCAPADQNRC